jgi:GT2 family glycosyltransferase
MLERRYATFIPASPASDHSGWAAQTRCIRSRPIEHGVADPILNSAADCHRPLRGHLESFEYAGQPVFRRDATVFSDHDVVEAMDVRNNASLPLVSIIVPVFNGEKYLRESLDSILAQTYPRTEILVMNDASTDSTLDIIATYGDRLRHYSQSQNKRQYQNVNEGLRMVQGTYIAVYHADDVYEPSIVQKEVEFFENHPEVGAVFCHDIFIDAEGHEYGRLRIPPELRHLPVLTYPTIFNAVMTHKNRFFPAPSSMVRASVYKDVGPYRASEFDIASDLEMWLRIGRKYPIGILPEYLFRYRHGHGNWSQRYRQLRTEEEGYFRIIDQYLSEGADRLATVGAHRAYEAHRAEDRLMRSINLYILGKTKEAKAVLSSANVVRILGSPAVQRLRLLTLFFAMSLLVRIPRVPWIANFFYRRWHVRKYMDPGA